MTDCKKDLCYLKKKKNILQINYANVILMFKINSVFKFQYPYETHYTDTISTNHELHH